MIFREPVEEHVERPADPEVFLDILDGCVQSTSRRQNTSRRSSSLAASRRPNASFMMRAMPRLFWESASLALGRVACESGGPGDHDLC